MSDDKTPDHTNAPATNAPATNASATSAPAQPAPGRAPSLTDAEANRQLGQGEAPHAVDAPESAQEPVAATPAAAETAPEGRQTVKVGARDVVRPTDHLESGDAGDIYDRLAKKDNTPVGPGGQAGVA